MSEVHKALGQIASIHEHLARTEVYRGYRAVPLAFSGLTGLLAAWLQPWVIGGKPASWFVYYWTVVAVIAFTVAMSEGVLHFLHRSTPYQRRRSVHVIGQFIPCLAAGACFAVFMVPCGEVAIRFLPGIWAILFSMGNFASLPYLPRSVFWLALGYFLAGVILLGLAESGQSLSPWGMGLTFGGGNIIAAALMYWSLERENSSGRE